MTEECGRNFDAIPSLLESTLTKKQGWAPSLRHVPHLGGRVWEAQDVLQPMRAGGSNWLCVSCESNSSSIGLANSSVGANFFRCRLGSPR